MDSEAVYRQMAQFPSTRYMGSKSKLVPAILDITRQLEFETALDLFSGTAVVSYLFKSMGKSVTANDYMTMAAVFSRALIENSSVRLSSEDVDFLLNGEADCDDFVERTFAGLYFCDEDNRFIDRLRGRVRLLGDDAKRALARAAIIRACMKRRPRGIFTYTGFRYDDGRRDLRLSLREHFVMAVEAFNDAVFDGGKVCRASQGDALAPFAGSYDLVYLDPPYYSPHSDNEYVRRYHFVEGLARDWEDVEIQEHTKTKKFKSYPTPFSTEKGAVEAFEKLFSSYERSLILVSYSSNSLPSCEDMAALLRNAGKAVEVIPVEYRYSFGNQSSSKTCRNTVEEYFFLGV